MAGALYLMPKAVVTSEQQSAEMATAQAPEASMAQHAQDLTVQQQEQLQAYRQRVEGQGALADKEKALASLLELYKQVNRYDSAAQYASRFQQQHPSAARLKQAAQLYYEAASFSLDKEKGQDLAKQAVSHWQQYCQQQPSDLDAQVLHGLSVLLSGNAMEGIGMVRGVLAKDPNHELALFNLGMLSMESGQYAKGLERFEKLAQQHPQNGQYVFYQGVCLKELGQADAALQAFERVKGLEKDPQVLSAVEGYLKELRSN